MVPDGFLVPGKGTGGLYVLLRKDNQNGGFSFSKGSSLVEKEDGWFYHMVNWRDVNLDGRMDIVTARAKAPLGGDFQGELIWLEQPATNPLGGNWKKETLAQGPDVLTVIGDFNTTDDLFELYAAEFFSNLLTVFEISEGDTVAVRQTSIIEKMEAPYDIHLVDLNLDGELNLLVSNHLGGAGGNVTAYTIPSIYMNGSAYQKHPLANGFIVTEPGANQMAPGFLTPYNINNFNIGKVPPSILVAGDGSQSGYIMTPTGNLVYQTDLLVDVEGVVGIIAEANTAPGGKAEFYLPNYDDNQILVFNYE